MVFHWKFLEEPERYPMQICFLESPSSELVEAAKKFDLPIILPEENNNNVKPKPFTPTIYVFNEFENNEMLSRIEEVSNTWILGKTALKEMSQNPDLKLKSKPTYCNIMSKYVFYINCPEDISLMNRLVKLIKWMGGSFVASPNSETTHMITNHTLAKGYVYCYTFGVPVVGPDWVEYCWLQRKVPSFDVTSVMNNYRIEAFLGLHLAFKGTFSTHLKALEIQAKSNGASIVLPENLHCTHLVVLHGVKTYLNIWDLPTHIQYIVHEEWLSSSIEKNHRDYEDNYGCLVIHEIAKSLWALSDDVEKDSKEITERKFYFRLLNSYEEKVFESAMIETQDMKRKFAFEELYLHEKNFLACLKQLCAIRDISTEPHQSAEAIFNKEDEKNMFGNLTKLIEIHQELLDSFENTLLTWTNCCETVHQLVLLKEKILKQYDFYIDNYKNNCEFIKENLNKHFQEVLQQFSCTATKEDKNDIFMRPIQRMCHLIIQLQEISRNTREDNPDKVYLKAAIKVVKNALRKVSYSPELITNFKNVCDIHHCIQNCPDYFISYYRQFHAQFSAQELVKSISGTETGMTVEFFLFNDILEIAKVRKTPFESQRSYFHLASLPLSMIVNVIEFERMEMDEPEVFGINVKNTQEEGSTCLYCFQYSKKNHIQLNDILLLIAKLLSQRDSSKFPEEFVQFGISITRISRLPITEKLDEYDNDVCNVQQTSLDHNHKTSKKRSSLRRSWSFGDLTEVSMVDML